MADERDSSDAIRVMIVDDHALFRRGLQMVLEQEADIDVVGEAGDGADAVGMAQEKMPDVVLMDVRMPGRGGIDATEKIKEVMPHVKILMLTVSDEEADLFDALKAGASGYLLKDTSIEEVAEAVRKVSHDESLISPSMLVVDGKQARQRVHEHGEARRREAIGAAAAPHRP
jgi:DNA-binding NarL/FixJ family response regulator